MAAAAALSNRPTFRESLLGSIFGDAPGSAYMSSGPVAERGLAIAQGRPSYGDPAESGLSFTVREARTRLADLVSGAVKVRSVGELITYLRDQFITPEIRTYGSSQSTLHLRDQINGGSAPGASVHSLLSKRGIRKLAAGREALAEAPSGPTPMEVRYQDALRLSYKGQPLGYSGWEALKTGLPAALSRKVALAYTVSDGVAYVGRPGYNGLKPLECLGSAQRTRDMLYENFVARRREQAQRGAEIARDLEHRASALPAPQRGELMRQATDTREKASRMANTPSLDKFHNLSPAQQTSFLSQHFVFDKAFAPRTPVLVRDKVLVEAARVDPALSAGRMEAAFGTSFSKFWTQFHKAQLAQRQEKNQDDKVVDFQAAAAALREGRTGAAASPSAAGAGFGGVAQSTDQGARSAIVIVADDTSPDLRICRHRPDGQHMEMPQVASLHALKPGEYRLLVAGAVYDAPSGYVVVDDAQGVTFLDAQRREHSLDGPSHIPAPGSKADARRWSIDGQSLDEASFEATLPPPPPEPEQDERYSGGFGFGSPT